MSLELDVVGPGGVRRVVLEAERSTVGTAPGNAVVVPDPTASRLHAVLERFPAGWLVRDLDSSNGTWLNGERIQRSRRLKNGDELRVGRTRLVIRSSDAVGAAATQVDVHDTPPELTRRERDVLVRLCRPLLAGDLFTEPAPTSVIADDLVITQAAVKQHLGRLYDKFEVPPVGGNRRMRLANAALRRGAVSLSDLRRPG